MSSIIGVTVFTYSTNILTNLPGYRWGFESGSGDRFARFFKTQDPDMAGKQQVQTNIKIFYNK